MSETRKHRLLTLDAATIRPATAAELRGRVSIGKVTTPKGQGFKAPPAYPLPDPDMTDPPEKFAPVAEWTAYIAHLTKTGAAPGLIKSATAWRDFLVELGLDEAA